MQALTLSLSPAGRGDEKSALSTASAEEEDSPARLSEAKDFEDSYKTASTVKSESDKEVIPESPGSNAKEITDQSNSEELLQTAYLVEGEKPNALPPKGEILSAKATDNSEASMSALKNQETISLTNEKPIAETGLSGVNKDVRAINSAPSDIKTNEVTLHTIKSGEAPQAVDIKLTEDAISKADVRTSVSITPENMALANSSETQMRETAAKAEIDKEADLNLLKPKEQSQLQFKEGEVIPSKIEENTNGLRSESKSTGRAHHFETETAPQLKEATNLVETDAIKSILDKQIDQKTTGKMDFLNGLAGNQPHSMGLQTSTGMESSFALSSLTSTTLSSTLSPSVQMISATASTAATNFNAVSQAILVANETAKGVTVQLDPPEMGRVYIDFSFDADDKVNVVVKSDIPESHFMLRERSEQFLSILKESGLEDVNLSFEQNNQSEHSDANEQATENPIYISASSDEAQPNNTPIQSLSKDIETYDGLDLRL